MISIQTFTEKSLFEILKDFFQILCFFVNYDSVSLINGI